MKKSNKNITLLLVLFHAVGVIGITFAKTRPYLIPLSPWIIFASFCLALYFQKPITFKLIVILLGIAICGFFIEYAGVATGWIFGQYHYGTMLGPAWNNIPFLIGITWCSLTYYTAQIQLFQWKHIWLCAAVSAALMTAYDFFLEPSAMAFGFWHWSQNSIPTQNYVAWFAVSFLFQLVLRYSGVALKNKMAQYIFIVQLGFFLLLYFIPAWG